MSTAAVAMGKILYRAMREDLAGGIFPETDGGVEILNLGKAVIGNELEDVGFGNFLEAAAEVTRFVFEQALAHFRGFFAFLLVDPVADLAFRRRRLHKAEPVAAGVVALLRQNLDHIAALDFMSQRNHLAIHFGAHALVPHFGVHHVRKIERGGPARQFQHAAFRRKRVDFYRGEIHFQGGKKLAWLLHLLRPLDELAHPGNALIVILCARLAGLVFPVRRHTFFRDAMHVLGANLHFK